MTTTALRYRVACDEHVTGAVTDLDVAHRRLTDIERLGACNTLHHIEVRDGDGWTALHIWRARQILAAPVGPAVIDTPDGPMIKAAGSWSKETAARADSAGEPGSPQWYAALGSHEHAVLTSDGRQAGWDGWHNTRICPDQAAAESWVRYERYTPEGRVGHGYICPTCRMLTQTG